MVDDDVRRRVADARVARMATVDREARPHVVPVCFALDGDRMFSVVDGKRKRHTWLKRLDNVIANPAVEVVVDHYDEDWSTLWWVRISARGRVLTRGAERDAAVDLLVAKYEQYRQRRPSGAVLALDIDRVHHWEAVDTTSSPSD